MATSQIRSQIVVAIGDLSVPASTVQVISGALAITNFSNSPVSDNLVQLAGAPIPIQGNTADAVTPISSALLPTQTFGYGFNGTTWDRLRSGGVNVDAIASTSLGVSQTQAFAYISNGPTWDRIIGANNPLIAGGGLTNGKGVLIVTPYFPQAGGATLGKFAVVDAGLDTNTDNRLYVYALGGYLNPAGSVDRARAALGTTGIAAVNTEGTRTTYSAAVAQAAFSAASGTDVFLLNGSVSNVSRIVRAEVSFTSLNPVNIPMRWVKRSAVTTAGTSSLPTMVVHDTSGAAATAVAVNYTNTAGQAPGAPIGIVRSAVVTATLASQGLTSPWVEDFSVHNEQSPLLRGTEVWALTLASGAQTTGASNISVNVTWTEAAA